MASAAPVTADVAAEAERRFEGDAEAPLLDEVLVDAERAVSRPRPDVAVDPAGFATVLEREAFAGQHLTLAELLLEAPGVVVRRGPGGDSLQLRGSSPDQSAVLLDGLRLDPAAGGGFDLRLLPVGLVDRVTVLRGNAGAFFGAGALGGVALIETRPPADGASGTVELSAGSFGTFGVDATAGLGGRAASLLAGISYARTEGDFSAMHDPTPAFDPTDARRATVLNNDFDRKAALLSGRVTVGEVELSALLHGVDAARGIPGTFFAPTPTLRRQDRLGVAGLRGLWRGGATELGLGVEGRGADLLVTDPSDTFAGGAASERAADPWQRERAGLVRTSAAGAPTDWLSLRGELAAGTEGIDSPLHGAAERTLVTVALAPELYPADAWTIAPAARLDRIGPTQGVSPKLGVAWRPIEWLELRASAARSFRAPSLGELHLEQGPIRPNPDLRPERGDSFDGGVVLRAARARLAVVGFYTRTDDLISYELLPGGLSRPFNFLDAEVRGVELDGTVRPLGWLELHATLGGAETANLRDDPRFWGKELPYRPAWRASGRASAAEEGLRASASVAWQSAQFTNRANSTELPGWVDLGLSTGLRVVDGPVALWTGAEIENLLDAARVDRLGLPQPGRAFFVTLRAEPPADDAGAAGP